jgi:hypothetical protein
VALSQFGYKNKPFFSYFSKYLVKDKVNQEDKETGNRERGKGKGSMLGIFGFFLITDFAEKIEYFFLFSSFIS